MVKRALVILVAAVMCMYGQAATKPDACAQIQMLNRALATYHYQPLVLNRDWSEMVFDKWIRTMDPRRYYFTQADLNALEQYRTNLSLYIKNGDCSFLDAVQQTFKKGVARYDSLGTAILSTPMDYNQGDTIHFSYRDTFSYTANNTALNDWVRRSFKYRTLQALYRPKDTLDKPFEKDEQLVLVNEPEVRKRLLLKLKHQTAELQSPAGGLANWVCKCLEDAIALCHDPHSAFFTSQDLNDFKNEMSAKALSFGIYFDDNANQEVEIVKVIPGGPAWKTNQVQKGDVMVQVQFPGKKAIDLTDADADEVDAILGANPGNRMDLVIRKPNGQVRNVHLQKEEMVVDENAIKSYVLQGERRIGYISLPGFYTDMENGGGQGCAEDVAREIAKLQAENIEGLIFDLRFNGGGSLGEARQLAGVFMDNGPICITQDARHTVQVMYSNYAGKRYRGPLLIMVNGLSASATEIFTGAMLDYNRALVVGAPTYGKATGQFFWPVDAVAASKRKPDESAGYIKATAEKFYNLKGGSHQKKGITPHIILPDFYDNLLPKEVEEPYALNHDSVSRAVNYSPLPPLPVTKLAGLSSQRVATNSAFNALAAMSDTFKYYKAHDQNLALRPTNYVRFVKAEQAEHDNLEKQLDNAKVVFVPSLNRQDFETQLATGTTAKVEDADLMKEVKKDIYIDESYRIMCDWLNAK